MHVPTLKSFLSANGQTQVQAYFLYIEEGLYMHIVMQGILYQFIDMFRLESLQMESQ